MYITSPPSGSHINLIMDFLPIRTCISFQLFSSPNKSPNNNNKSNTELMGAVSIVRLCWICRGEHPERRSESKRRIAVWKEVRGWWKEGEHHGDNETMPSNHCTDVSLLRVCVRLCERARVWACINIDLAFWRGVFEPHFPYSSLPGLAVDTHSRTRACARSSVRCN